MRIYSFKGIDGSGQNIDGEISAVNHNKATLELYKKGISPRSLNLKKTVIKNDLLIRKVKTKDVINFTRKLEMMLKSGLPITKALSSIRDQENKGPLRTAIEDIILKLESGSYLSEALKDNSEIFSEYYSNMIKAGEKAGIVPDILGRIAESLERESELKKEIRDALIYPFFILSVATIVIFLIIIFVIPVFQEMFTSFGSDLPTPTKMVISASSFLKENFFLITLFPVITALMVKAFYRSEKGRYRIDFYLFKIPLIGSLLIKKNISSFAGTMNSMIESGLTINESLSLSSRTSGNRYMSRIIEKVNQNVAEGEELTEAFKKTGFFTPVSVSLIAAGDATGSLGTMFRRLSDLLDEELKSLTANFIKLLEPSVIIITGFIIAALIISIYLPVFHLPGTMGS